LGQTNVFFLLPQAHPVYFNMNLLKIIVENSQESVYMNQSQTYSLIYVFPTNHSEFNVSMLHFPKHDTPE